MSYRKKKIKIKVQGLKKLGPKTPFFKKPIFWIVFLITVFCYVFIYVFIISDILQIKNINISGNEKINSQELGAFAEKNINKKIPIFLGWSISSKSIFLANTENIKNEIIKNFPQIEIVSVEKKFLQTINIKIKERKPIAIFCQIEKNCLLIDLNGVIFEKPIDFLENMTVVKQQSIARYFLTGEQAVEKNTMFVIYKTIEILKNNYKINIKNALITNPLRLNLTTNEGWNIYFDLGSDTNFQINKLDLLLKNEISEQVRKSLQYIDLRFKDRAYYR